MLLTASSLCKSFGSDIILNNISFSLNKSEKIGIVGKNGAGKTTLLNLIAGSLCPDSGTISKSSAIKIGQLMQMPSLNLSANAYDNLVVEFEDLLNLECEIADIQNKLSNIHDKEENKKLLDKYAALLETYEKKDGYSYPSLIKGALNGFGFKDEELLRPVGTFSGGQQNKIAFIKLLLQKPDILLLDEPTNYFDIATISWLENYLKNYPGAIIIISHDRYFLDALADRIFEIENATLTIYNGNYTNYTKLKIKKNEEEYDKYIQQKKEILRQEQIIARFRQYNKEKSIKQAESKQKALDKITPIEKPSTSSIDMRLSFKCSNPSGKTVLEIKNLSKFFDSKTIIKDFSHTFYKHQKTGIFGANGIGKSTLLKIIAGIDPAYCGEINYGHNVQIAYNEQQFHFKHKTVLDEIVYLEDQTLTLEQARKYLALFLFFANDVNKEISVLSGGEKSRLNLLKTMLKSANLLLLDEPTNHLDISAVEALENALQQYDGTLIFISHDRYFLNNLCDHLLVFENNTINYYDGNYDYYISRKKSREEEIQATENKQKNKRPLRDNTFKKITLRIEELDQLISKLENKIDETETLMCQNDFYKAENSSEIIKQYENNKDLLKEYENEWLELNDKMSNHS